MKRLIQKFCKWSISRAKKHSKLGATVWVWFPNVKKCFKMRISSFRSAFFTARFINQADYDRSRVSEDFGQTDNDIIVDLNTCYPAFRG